MKKKRRDLASNACRTDTADSTYELTSALESQSVNGFQISEDIGDYLYDVSPGGRVGEGSASGRHDSVLNRQGRGHGQSECTNDACVEEKKNSPHGPHGIHTEGSPGSRSTPEDSPSLVFASSSERYFSPEGPQRSGPGADLFSVSKSPGSGSETPVSSPLSPDTYRLSPPAYTSLSLIPPNVYSVGSCTAWGEGDAKIISEEQREAGRDDDNSNGNDRDFDNSNTSRSNSNNLNSSNNNDHNDATKIAKKFKSKYSFTKFENSESSEGSRAVRSTHGNTADSGQSVRHSSAGKTANPQVSHPHSSKTKNSSSSRSPPTSKPYVNPNYNSARRDRQREKEKSEKDKDKGVPVKTNVLVADEAFARSLSDCFAVRLLPRELAIILDSLGFPLNADTVKICNRNSTMAGAGKNSFIELSLFNENLFASTLCDAVRANGFMERTVAQPGEVFSISKKKTLIAMNQIKSLLVGEWVAVREFVLKITRVSSSASASEDDDNRNSHSCYESKGNGVGNNDNSADSVVDCRPSLWPKNRIEEFLSLCQFSNSSSGTSSIETGRDFLDTKLEHISSTFGITQSLLRERFIVYQRFLRILDVWWGRGLRPSDPYSATFKMLADTLTVETDVSYLCEGRPGEREGEGEGEDGAPSDGTVPYTAGSSDANFTGASHSCRNDSNISSSCSSVTRHDVLDAQHTTHDEIVRLSPTPALLLSWSPVNRAYGWNVPLSVLTSLSKRIGGMS